MGSEARACEAQAALGRLCGGCVLAVNRFLVLPRAKRVPFNAAIMPGDDVPQPIVSDCKSLFEFDKLDSNGVPDDRLIGDFPYLHNEVTPPALRLIDMSPEADGIYRECLAVQEDMLQRSDTDKLFEAWSRYAEMTQRVALIVACGRYARYGLYQAEISGDDMGFARRLVSWSMEQFVNGLRDHMAENDNQANSKAVRLFIRKGGKKGVTRSELYRHMDSRLLSRDLDAILSVLAESEEIEVIELKRTDMKPGKPKKIYITGRPPKDH